MYFEVQVYKIPQYNFIINFFTAKINQNSPAVSSKLQSADGEKQIAFPTLRTGEVMYRSCKGNLIFPQVFYHLWEHADSLIFHIQIFISWYDPFGPAVRSLGPVLTFKPGDIQTLCKLINQGKKVEGENRK